MTARSCGHLTITSANSWLLSILGFIHSNVLITSWEMVRASVWQLLSEFSFSTNIFPNRFRYVITFWTIDLYRLHRNSGADRGTYQGLGLVTGGYHYQ